MKKYKIMAVLAVTALAPFFTGCRDISCQQVLVGQDAALEIQSALQQIVKDPKARWSEACVRIEESSAILSDQIAKMKKWDEHKCADPSHRDPKCANAKQLRNNGKDLISRIDQKCSSRLDENEPYSLKQRDARELLSILEGPLAAPGNRLLAQVCELGDQMRHKLAPTLPAPEQQSMVTMRPEKVAPPVIIVGPAENTAAPAAGAAD
ncbi:hypothetical protein WDW37_01660 [Bdellovibrionota bacterium FG-1]